MMRAKAPESIRRLRRAVLSLATLVLILGGVAPSAARDALTLRVNDAIGAPGGLVAVVLRTYASRPIGQGQVCFFASRVGGGGLAGGPFASMEGFEVFSKKGDALGLADLEVTADGQMVVLQFSSPSSTINRVEGPLAVAFFRLRDSLTPGSRFELSIDLPNTMVFGGDGQPVPLEGRAGELRVRATSDPFTLEAEGDKVTPGEIAELGVETFEPFSIAAGQVALRYDEGLAPGRPKVKMNRRHGRRRFTVDRSTPGLVLVSFRSRDASLNRVPGQIVRIRVATAPGAEPGSRSRVWLDPSLTFLEDAEGDLLPIKLKKNWLRIE